MDREQLVVLYELKRQSFLIGFIGNPERFSPALAYAYFHRVAPLFHENSARETHGSDPFDEVYAVKRDFVDEVTRYVEDRWHANDLQAIGFYNLEDKFGRSKRVELLCTLEYARIDRRFNDAVWAAIEKHAPVEANSLDATFSPDDVGFG